MLKFLKNFEKVVVYILLILMMIALALATIELGILMYQEIMKPPKFMLNLAELLTVFGFFLMVLIGLELLETIKTYVQDDKFHLEVVMMVAMIAIARKIIILDYSIFEPQTLYGMAAMIVGLSVSYYLVKKARREKELAHNTLDKIEKTSSLDE